MRLKSGIWVAAFIRRCQAEGAPAVVMRRGAEEAGAIFVVVDRLDGTNDFYAPAPQTEVSEDVAVDRLFQKVIAAEEGHSISERIARETRFDPDIWVVAVEDRAGRSFLETV